MSVAKSAVGKVTIAPPADWVEQHTQDQFVTEDTDGSYRYHLADYQHNVEAGEIYEHYMVSILTETGVEEFSQLNFEYQPEYESILLHHITLIRDGEEYDRLTGTEIEILRREEDMEDLLYDGEMTALVVLKDVQPGDVISYAFTTVGKNPVFKGMEHNFIRLGYSSPTGTLRRKVLWDPDERQMKWQIRGVSDVEPKTGSQGDMMHLEWVKEQATRITIEDNTPPWIYDYPQLEYSDCPDWETFGKWALELYETDQELPKDILDLCNQIDKDSANDEERIISTLRWVQRNVRYLGSFFGKHTHEPYPLSTIYERRFGDCKDKGILTVAMLKELGFDAAPALVNTSRRKAIGEHLPGSAAFNHLIVHLSFEGNDYYLDPTHTYQRGILDQLSLPDYGFAFHIRTGANSLTEVEPRGTEVDKTHIHETYVVRDKFGSAELKVVTEATGGDANSMRSFFSSNSHESISDDYRDFYTRDFETVEILTPIKFEDDPEKNKVTIYEHYEIPNFWVKSDDGDEMVAWTNANFLMTSLTYPEKEDREQPMSKAYPSQIRQVIEVNLPEEWQVDNSTIKIDHPAFEYKSVVKKKTKGFTLTYDYKAISNVIKPGDFNDYVDKMNRVHDDMSFQVYHSDFPNMNSGNAQAPVAASLGMLFVGGGTVTGLLIGFIIAILLWFWDPAPRTPETTQYEGIGGWLILPTIGSILGPLALLLYIASFFLGLQDVEETLESETGLGNWRIYYVITPLLNSILFSIAVLQLVLLFKKRTSFPWIFICLAVMTSVFDGYVMYLESNLEFAEDTELTNPAGGFVSLVIWGLYMLLSQRVKATFRVRRKSELPPPLPAQPA